MMKNWQRQSINKSLENYAKTKDIEHLMDIIRVYEYSKMGIIKSLVGARLKEILITIYYYIVTKERESSNEVH